MPWFQFDLEDGKPPVGFSLKSDDAARFVNFMAECQRYKTANAELLVDAFGNPRTIAKRITLDGTSLICRPDEVKDFIEAEDESAYTITDVYLSDYEIERLPEFEGW
jgi:hypothetical protein